MSIRVTYLEQTAPAPPPALHWGSERILPERLHCDAYLELYGKVGAPVHWDQRSRMPRDELEALLAGDALRIYVLRDAEGRALGLCEFDRREFPDVELKNFGVVTHAQGRGLGPWLLATALQYEWRSNPDRIWLHTDTMDHPAARKVYARAGFSVFDERDEDADPL